MIKDILVSLPIGRLSDSAVNYAVSVAEAFDAHLTGVAFVHEPFVPRTVFSGAATGFIAPYRAEVEKAAKASPRQGKGLMAPDVLPCLGISIMQPDAQPRRVSNSRHFMRFAAEDYAAHVEVYHISERRLCHASRSNGPKDNFSTDQALNDLKDRASAGASSKALMLNGRLCNTSKGGKNENVTSSLVLVRTHFCPVRMAGMVLWVAY